MKTHRKQTSRPNEIAKNDEPAKSRYIASEVSERVHDRANYRCQSYAFDGTRCSSRTGLQIEHVRPFGIFRSNDERLLQILYAHHNGLAAERVILSRAYTCALRGRLSSSGSLMNGADVAKRPGYYDALHRQTRRARRVEISRSRFVDAAGARTRWSGLISSYVRDSSRISNAGIFPTGLAVSTTKVDD